MSCNTMRWSVGLWALLLALAPACSNDDACAGVANVCDTENAAQCTGDIAQRCQPEADGCLVWTDIETCTANQTCTDGDCVCNGSCVAGDDRCDQEVLQNCVNESGCTVWEDAEDCGANGGTCYDPGTPRCVSASGCGDDSIAGTEVCDGPERGGEDCVSQGFDSGDLACNDTCDAFDTSLCITYPPGGTCDDAYDLTGETFPFTLMGTFPDHPAVGFSCDSDATNVAWFHYTATTSATHVISASGTIGNSWGRLVVLDSIGCDPYATEVGCMESLGSLASLTVPLSAGNTYLIATFTDGLDFSLIDPTIDIQAQ